MLKDIRNIGKKNAPAPLTKEENDIVKGVMDDFMEHLEEEHPDLAKALNRTVILRNALDNVFDYGAYGFDPEGVIDKLEKKAPTPTRKGEQTKKNKNAKRRGKRGKGLKKPKTEI